MNSRPLEALLLTALLIFVGPVLAQPQPGKTPRAGAGGPRTDLENDAKIRDLFHQFEAAWNRHDFEALKALWTIDAQVSRRLVQLVFHGIGRDDLDVHVDDRRGIGAGRDAVPRMRLEEHR